MRCCARRRCRGARPELAMFPTRALFWLLLLPFGLSILAALEPSVLGPTLLADAAIAGLALIDALLGLGAKVRINREAPAVFSLGRHNRVRLHVASTARRPLRLRLTDEVDVPGKVVGLPVDKRLAP